jgi:hypothetical protein
MWDVFPVEYGLPDTEKDVTLFAPEGEVRIKMCSQGVSS